jgi:hypothetical protein
MKKRTVFPLLVLFVFSLACQVLSPVSREGTVISDCMNILDSISNLQPADVPQQLMDSGIKSGDEFDANEYFSVLSHVSMQEGYVLDYLYPVESLGSSPVLYARPEDQLPYAAMEDIPENMELPDFRDHMVVDDTAQGYFEYVAMDIMAGQFYLVWHANYNDTQIVCNSREVNDIISNVNSGGFGNKLDLAQQTKARVMGNIEPLVDLTGDSAMVQVVIFTKWGGFYRLTYEISRAFPHTIINVKEENVVPYDCGIMF